MYNPYLYCLSGFFGGIGATIAIAAVLYALHTLADHDRRLRELESASKPKRNSAITARGRETAENLMPYICDLVEDAAVIQARAKTAMMLMEHVAKGGEPDDPPATWFQKKGKSHAEQD